MFKKLFLSLLVITFLFCTLLNAADSKLSYRFWNALKSNFDEYPSPKNPPERVWGNFGTNFNRITYEKKLNSNFHFDLAYDTSTILRNKMNIRNANIGAQYGFIGGTNSAYSLGMFYRHWQYANDYSDIILGYEHQYTIKKFYDRNDDSDIGNYQSYFSGFNYGWRGQKMLNEKIGMKAKITLQPTIHNMTWVKDPFGGESSYVTTGTSKYFEVAFVWLVTPDWEYTLGHVYKTYYFKPVADNYNLTINYDGLFIETTCKF